MFRQQYPEAPHLYSSFRRPRQRTLVEEIQRTWLTSFIGFVLIVVGLGGLLWNETRTVQVTKSLDEGHKNLVVPETNDVVFEENNGKLIFVADQLTVPDALADEAYGISINAVKLKKKVQMYQWYEMEDRKELSSESVGEHDGHVDLTYSYDTDWFDKLIDSSTFNSEMGHHNPETWPINSSVLVNSRVKLGNFLLGKEAKYKFNEYHVFTSDERPSNPDIKMHAGLYIHGQDVWRPDVGDIRVQFMYSGKDGDQVTLIGKQSGREIRPYQTESGEELLILHPGLRTAEDIFNMEHSQNRIQTFFYRIALWFICFLGFNCWSSILDLIVTTAPEVRNTLSLGYTSLPFSFSASFSLLVSGAGWLYYRPLLGLTLMTLAAIPSMISLFRWQQMRSVIHRHHLS